MNTTSIDDVIQRPEEFRYQLLSRLCLDLDCMEDGVLPTKLWAKDIPEQLQYMRAIWDSFPEDRKPQWLTKSQLQDYFDWYHDLSKSMGKDKPLAVDTGNDFVPQIKNVEILRYPVKAGSGNWGIAAEVLGERKRAVLSLIEESAWIKASPEEKPLVAMEIAASKFRNDLLDNFNMDYRKIQSPQELMYHLWDETGRQAKGAVWDIMIDDKKYFPDKDETTIDFDIHDGFAVGEYEGKEYVMIYPTMLEVKLTKTLRQSISGYIGQAVTDTGICPADIAITCGKIILAKPLKGKERQINGEDAKQCISEIRIRKGMDNNMYISCKVLGVQQLSKRMSQTDVNYYQDRMRVSDKMDNEVASELAGKYYKNEIALANTENVHKGRGR